MTRELSYQEYKSTFGESMTDISNEPLDSIDIWSYATHLLKIGLINEVVVEDKVIAYAYCNSFYTFSHILLSVGIEDVFMIIVVNLKTKSIEGHYRLNLKKDYGLK